MRKKFILYICIVIILLYFIHCSRRINNNDQHSFVYAYSSVDDSIKICANFIIEPAMLPSITDYQANGFINTVFVYRASVGSSVS